MDTLVLASGNQKKLDEMRAILEPLALKVVPQSDFQVPEAEETGLTFVENAILKARNAAAHTGLPAIADDSGLEVDALNGAPGIYSARFSGADASDAKNNALLIDMLGDLPDAPRTARYQAVLVLMRHPDDPTSTWLCSSAGVRMRGDAEASCRRFHMTRLMPSRAPRTGSVLTV